MDCWRHCFQVNRVETEKGANLPHYWISCFFYSVGFPWPRKCYFLDWPGSLQESTRWNIGGPRLACVAPSMFRTNHIHADLLIINHLHANQVLANFLWPNCSHAMISISMSIGSYRAFHLISSTQSRQRDRNQKWHDHDGCPKTKWNSHLFGHEATFSNSNNSIISAHQLDASLCLSAASSSWDEEYNQI